jgi:ankyrin repeat protein
MMAAAASSTARPRRLLEEARLLLRAKCSLEAFREFASEFPLLSESGWDLYLEATWFRENEPIRVWLRSTDFAARFGAIKWGDPLGVFLDACETGDEEYVSRMCQEQPTLLDGTNGLDGVTVLHSMCRGGLLRFVPELIARCGEVDVRATNGETPLHEACLGGHWDVFDYLLSRGADARAVTDAGWTMLCTACIGGNVAIVRALLEQGMDMAVSDGAGLTPLHRACQAGHTEVVALLVERGALIDSRVSFLTTPLHCACEAGNLGIVRYLCEHGAAIDVRQSAGFSPLVQALRHCSLDCAQYLLDAGASMAPVRAHKAQIHSSALVQDSVPVVEFLLERGVLSISSGLILRCVQDGFKALQVLRYLLLHEQSVPFLSHVDVSLLPDGFLGGCASLSKWREHELRMDLRYRMLSWRRGFVVSRL